MSANRTSDAATAPETAETGRRLAWPGDPEAVTAADIDFEALAHVLANTCRWGGRTPRYHALAAHALIASEEIEALDGLGPEDRRTLALHALLMVAPAAWLGADTGASQGAVSQRTTDRTGRLAAGIEERGPRGRGARSGAGRRACRAAALHRPHDLRGRAPRPVRGRRRARRGRGGVSAPETAHPPGRAGPGRKALARPLPGACPPARWRWRGRRGKRNRRGQGPRNRRRLRRRDRREDQRWGGRRCHGRIGEEGTTDTNRDTGTGTGGQA